MVDRRVPGRDETFVSPAEVKAAYMEPDGTVSARRVPVTRARLTALVRATAPFKNATAAAPKVLNDSAAAWRQLYTLLVAPVRAQFPAAPGTLLTIVRHDVLSNLSFAALQDSRGRYLLEDFALHYAPLLAGSGQDPIRG